MIRVIEGLATVEREARPDDNVAKQVAASRQVCKSWNRLDGLMMLANIRTAHLMEALCIRSHSIKAESFDAAA